MIEADKLIGHEFNWRKHPVSQTNALKQIVNDVGFVAPILAIQTSKGYKIIDGHLRTGIAGNQKVPVVVLDLTEAEAKKVLATIDNITGMAQEDPTRLHELVLSLSAKDQKIMDEVLAETPQWGLAFDWKEDVPESSDLKTEDTIPTSVVKIQEGDKHFYTIEMTEKQARQFEDALIKAKKSPAVFVYQATLTFISEKWSFKKS